MWHELIDAGVIQLIDVDNEDSVYLANELIENLMDGTEKMKSVDFLETDMLLKK